VAITSYRRQGDDSERPQPRRGRLGTAFGSRPPWHYALAGLAGVVVAFGAAVILLVTSSASLTADSSALASVGMPLGGGSIESVTVFRGGQRVGDHQAIAVQARGDQIYPRVLVPVDQIVTVDVVVKRPGWVSWLTGQTEHLHLTTVTPVASLREHYLTLAAGAPLRLRFKQPVAVVSYGAAGGPLRRDVLSAPASQVTVPRSAPAGSISVAAAPRAWEQAGAGVVSWFPAGSASASAVVSPAPGRQIGPSTPITLTFSKPVSEALGSSRPPVANATGHWQTVNSHTIVFKPTGFGYGLASTVSLSLPRSVSLIGDQQSGSGAGASWTVPAGSTLRLQQLLANMGYLPLRFHNEGRGSVRTPQAEEAAAIHPPKGSFRWRYGDVPFVLRSLWAPGASGVMTKGAIMAFENDEGMTPDGIPGATLWHALIAAAVASHRSSFGYTIALVSETLPESLHVWHNGKIVQTSLVNTGISAAPTALGTYPVFSHIPVGTMSGTNPDGSSYSDPGIPSISYFNGGDALHGFIRGGYGYPQSLGCVEMPYADADAVYPYTPVGTLVNVSA